MNDQACKNQPSNHIKLPHFPKFHNLFFNVTTQIFSTHTETVTFFGSDVLSTLTDDNLKTTYNWIIKIFVMHSA